MSNTPPTLVHKRVTIFSLYPAPPCTIPVPALLKENQLLSETMVRTKNEINHQKKWDIAKKYTNEYEFVFSLNNEGVADFVPISRSFFKLVEIVYDTHLFETLRVEPSGIVAACLCEGPGGFVQALTYIASKKQIPVRNIYGISLITKDRRIPNWKIKNSNVIRLCGGKNGSGDLYHIDNIHHFSDEVGRGACHLVTADGGFDFSHDFNRQEIDFARLFLAEIYTAALVQKNGGTFVVKVFDLFQETTVLCTCVLASLYSSITLHKPSTSRPANSERYLICEGYNAEPRVVEGLRTAVLVTDDARRYSALRSIVSDELFHSVLGQLVAINRDFAANQRVYIEKALHALRDSNRLTLLASKRMHIDRCIEWCRRYDIPVKKHHK